MKKTALSFMVLLTFFLFSVFDRITYGSKNSTLLSDNNSSSQPLANPSITDFPTLPETKNNANSSSGFKNGTFTGRITDAFYGNIQVEAVIASGKISDIKFLQYPNDRSHSIEINHYALPILKSEAIQKQSAKVDFVSGATDTSDAFIQSLQSALDNAKA